MLKTETIANNLGNSKELLKIENFGIIFGSICLLKIWPEPTPQTPSVPFLNPSEPGATSNIASIYAVVSEPTGYYLYKISDSSMKVDW